MVRLSNFHLNNDWSNTISIDNCVICHSQKFDIQPSGKTQPEYRNSEFIFQHFIKTLIGHTRYHLFTLTRGIRITMSLPPFL